MIVSGIFWGFILASIGFSAAGLVNRSPRFLFVAAGLALPLAFYLALTPRFRWMGLFIPVPQMIAGLVVRRLPWLAVALASFFPAFVVWMTTLAGSSRSVPAV
jgi:hypothetical protein